MDGSTPGFPVLQYPPGVCSGSCPLSWWCYLTISSSAAPFSFCLQSFPASRSFPKCCLSASGDQSIGASASASVLPVNVQGWFPFELTGLISLQSKGLSRVFTSTTVQKHQFFGSQPSLWSTSHIHTWLLEKLKLWRDGTLLTKWCLCFLICCLRLSSLSFKEQVSFHGFSHCPQWFLEPKKMNSATISIFPHLFAMKQWDRMPWS